MKKRIRCYYLTGALVLILFFIFSSFMRENESIDLTLLESVPLEEKFPKMFQNKSGQGFLTEVIKGSCSDYSKVPYKNLVDTCISHFLPNGWLEKRFSEKNFEVHKVHNLTKVYPTPTQAHSLNFVTDRNKLIECIKYYFKLRYNYLFQYMHDEDSLRLQLQLISRQLCLTQWDNLDLTYFNELSLVEENMRYRKLRISYEDLQKGKPFLTSLNASYCMSKKSIFFSQGYFSGSGFGSRIHNLLQATKLSFTYRRNPRLLLIESGFWEFIPVKCDFKGYRCLFHDISACHVHKSQFTQSFRNSLKRNKKWNDSASGPKNTSVCHTVINNGRMAFIPDEYKHRGRLWYNSQILYFILQPKPRVIKEIERRYNPYSHIIQGGISILHIRHGDKWLESRIFSHHSYIRALKTLLKLNESNLDKVLVSSDDSYILEKMELSENSLKYFQLFSPTNKSGGNSYKMIRTNKLDRDTIAYDLLSSLYLVKYGKFFVGTFSSNFSRLYLKLMIALNGAIPNHLSLTPWKHDSSLLGLDLYSVNITVNNEYEPV